MARVRMWDVVWVGMVVVVCMGGLKLALVPSYASTDYYVHRAWLALTHTTPMAEWYTDATSQWTLDYPPFFAWFEYLLSLAMPYIEPSLVVKIDDAGAAELDAASPRAKIVHRATVMVADLVLALGAVYAVYGFWYPYPPRSFAKVETVDDSGTAGGIRGGGGVAAGGSSIWSSPQAISLVLILGSPALLLLDHVHFQYNGMLTGLLLLSIGGVTSRSGYALTAAAYAALLGFKHLYLVLGLVYTVFLFKAVVVQPRASLGSISLARFAILAGIVVAVLGAAFAPFVAAGSGWAMLERLFPFKRGLVHAYWAPNVWALYCGAEVALSSGSATRLTSGLVGEGAFSVLPSISPGTTALLTVLAMLPSVAKVWLTTPAGALVAAPRGDAARFLRYLQRPAIVFIHGLVEVSLASFLFGWHVHEKALIVPLIPLAVLAPTSPRYAGMFTFLQAVAHVALFPLFPPGVLTPLKIGVSVCYTLYIYAMLSPALPKLYVAYLVGLVPMLGFAYLVAPLALPSLVFLPTMAISLYCAVGVVMAYLWILLY
ncbi:dolichyl glycosyltransferase [Thecamonas trahens ATCC 50062]|uniref:Alpha-1,3-glucosyltransferase n=1 Tax=Thecamonas trahens ATCC 50062 TaxID=461836 RepID=A0A0L0DI35_THETB|nr:dolichyl glycosyltransferase [Thecamonas trahens ATCC 50062]KNC52029.1 dolichyl glycosyltransferase [Thecamonas trahens ATCC 50062]|eukprot:XP_013755612.1 dolichyl glycosyltransferase [Thecamonas trahens ATCC 50062]